MRSTTRPGLTWIDELPNRLSSGGRCIVTCGRKLVLTRLIERAGEAELQAKILQETTLDDLPEEHLEGVLVEIR